MHKCDYKNNMWFFKALTFMLSLLIFCADAQNIDYLPPHIADGGYDYPVPSIKLKYGVPIETTTPTTTISTTPSTTTISTTPSTTTISTTPSTTTSSTTPSTTTSSTTSTTTTTTTPTPPPSIFKKTPTPGPGEPGHVHIPGPPYTFKYNVKDDDYGTDFSQFAESNGDQVIGGWRVLLPDGRTQIVSYVADWSTGFHPVIKYEGEAKPYDEQIAKYAPRKKQPVRFA